MAVQSSAVQPSPTAGRHPDFAAQLQHWQARIERELSARLPATDIQPKRLHEAIRYSVLGGGKRVRPALVYATGAALGIPESILDGAACAVELIHAYSLVHDDLPAMDNDDLRRGRPTCHKQFDEATAILVGDSLQCLAFELLTDGPGLPADPGMRLKLVRLLAIASGTDGMAGGQALDLAAIGRKLSLAEVEEMHVRKTGALIHACVMMGAACAPQLSENITRALDEYARAIGLAFQIQDDLLDVEGDVAVIGKATGADRALDKPTYPSVAGVEPSRQRMHELHTQALSALARLDAAGLQSAPLAAMSDWLVLRKY
ncbi:polyprenyl synthetase family protein [Steroidobacter agaridevorans]|uniref:polyprenyl synthetase family protein n=1 Tax=Steroidobacter agaridevorans TaxID=2695856 RepID=UPI001323EB22|nr:farnesyl diphosphate synthase [Steroidobacter agaridevorans]GFE90749.1 (2E,6E)-farnesyl diphosphate synthase [Steroidobacter agaridevorans]